MMNKKTSCIDCTCTAKLISRKKEIIINGEKVQYKLRVYHCSNCNNEFERLGILDSNLESLREAYERATMIRSPAELKVLRGKYNASQKAFGLLLGFGESTMARYEQGAIPNAPNRLLLKLSENSHIFHMIYKENKLRISMQQRKKIEESNGYIESL